jgi:hypothetical protein
MDTLHLLHCSIAPFLLHAIMTSSLPILILSLHPYTRPIHPSSPARLPCSLFPVPCSMFHVPCSRSLFPVPTFPLADLPRDHASVPHHILPLRPLHRLRPRIRFLLVSTCRGGRNLLIGPASVVPRWACLGVLQVSVAWWRGVFCWGRSPFHLPLPLLREGQRSRLRLWPGAPGAQTSLSPTPMAIYMSRYMRPGHESLADRTSSTAYLTSSGVRSLSSTYTGIAVVLALAALSASLSAV